MNQIKRKRRLSPLEAAVLGNILYLVIVLIYKSVFDVVRTDSFDYLFNGVQLLTIGIFWMALFVICFKNISSNEKPRVFKYIFFSLMPIVVLTASLTLVSLFAPGQDTMSVWNQFAFLAAPTIFWYLPFGLIYQLVGSSISIFAFFGISLIFTVVFQIIGVVLGRIMGHKYLEETKVEDTAAVASKELSSKKEKKKTRKKSKLPQRESIGIDGFSEEMINEGFTPDEGVNMTEVIINDKTGGRKPDRQPLKSETGLFERVVPFDEQLAVASDQADNSIEPAKIPSIITEKTAETVAKETAADDWKVSEPMTLDQAQEKLKKHEESNDKSFLKETSAIRIINEEDIEEYYRNKK